ncbi:SDR family oxidoreductase [Halobacillus salinus]|uniref:SDR family NAD(P)-dependent oxidoreductase n=1 Tax=Halobacillus salinus TaxID=192814 RepID=A0A4Z0GWE0_9BACI|nr:SDR family oxidoreductase [Halobacillus salinus]TGB01961.1 SDR family NAD(P)-dependent oxidoreductase [Halobacillus salinus]
MKILLTGSTGFVGKQLTLRLLEEGHQVFALVRNEKKAEMLKGAVAANDQNRLNILHGNITQEHGGLSAKTIESLKGSIDCVYHIAAYLSFDDEEKEQLYEINVGGTKNLLELAKELQVKKFFHVSTAYTLGNQEEAVEQLHSLERSFLNYYEKTKCQAEHLVFDYADHFQVNIFRPSIIIGDSKTGEAESTFALYGIIRSFQLMKRKMERKGNAPAQKVKFVCYQGAAQNLIPVDHVVKGLVAGLRHADHKTIYHLTNDHPPSNAEVFELLKDELDFHNVELVSPDRQNELSDQEKLFNEPLSVFHAYLKKTIHFDNKNAEQLFKQAGVEPVDVTEDVLRTIISGKNRI